MPTAQTKATEKWQKKAGYMTKGFKLKRELADEFKEAGERAEKRASASEIGRAHV